MALLLFLPLLLQLFPYLVFNTSLTAAELSVGTVRDATAREGLATRSLGATRQGGGVSVLRVMGD